MRINTNTFAINATNTLSARENALGKSLEKLSSGYRINRAADDAAGLVISQKLRGQISGLKVATRNVQDGISIMQVAEGTFASVSDGLQRMHDLVVQYANLDGSDTTAKTAISDEWENIRHGLGDMFTNTKWGTSNLLANGFNRSFQVGADAGDTIVADQLADLSADVIAKSTAIFAPVSLPIDATVNYEDWGGSGTADMMTAVAAASDTIAWARGWFGAMQNRLESTLQNLQTTTENLSASESRIRDTDMASEMVNFTRHQILMQAGTAMLAQANQLPQSTLRLLQ